MSDSLPGLSVNAGVTRRFGGPNGYGHKYDGFTPKMNVLHLARRLGWKVGGAASASLKDAVLDPKGPSILNQVQTSACVGHAHNGAASTRFVKMGNPAPYKFSSICIYDIARLSCMSPLADGSFPDLTDDGTYPSAAIRGMSEWGVCSYDTRPTNVTTVNDKPKLREYEEATAMVIRGAYECTATGQAREDQIQAALINGFPMTVATIVDPAFENWMGGDPIGAPDMSQGLGGHDIYFVGFETLQNGQVVYEIANSWDTVWGNGGFGLVSGAWVQATMDVICMDINHTGVQ